jgi:predicted porin
MNKKISAAVASAALVLGATSANAGIIIPAGEWTLDVNGNVNVYASVNNADDTATITGGLAGSQEAGGEDKEFSIGTGLLPAWLGFTGTTRQNDLDVSFTISMQPNVSDNSAAGDSKTPLFRQAFLTFGDKSWGTVKMGKDLGIFAGQAILNDMTLLGMGAGVDQSGQSTTLGGIGSGYIYPAWKGQVAYTTPNMNGFTATLGIMNPNGPTGAGSLKQDRFGIEGQLQYEFSNGKVWMSGASYKVNTSTTVSHDATAVDIGAALNFGNAGIVAYYYDGDGAGTTTFGSLGNTGALERESDGGYVQGTYVIPTGTKLGVAYGISKLDCASGESCQSTLLEENSRWTVGAYHPLTKHLNLVAEFNSVESDGQTGTTRESDSVSLGAILFF